MSKKDFDELRIEYSKTYDKGLFNHLVRAWFYLKAGLNLVNDFKYLVAGIIALYYTLKLDSVSWLAILFVVSLPVLVVIGWFYTHKMAKALEWTGMIFSSYFARYNTDMAEKNVESMSKSAESLEKIERILEENIPHEKKPKTRQRIRR